MKTLLLHLSRIILFLILIVSNVQMEVMAQLNHQWVWQSGESSAFQPIDYGSQGVPSKINHPGARRSGMSWIGKEGNLWLMGGATSIDTIFTDLWTYNPSINKWTWEAGSKSFNEYSVYGTKGIASSSTMPGSRRSGHSWTDEDGNLWLFGGEGYDIYINSGINPLGHLWKFDISLGLWTWQHGEIGSQVGVYNNSDTARPGSRYGGGTWQVGNSLYLFGGIGFGADLLQGGGYLNDLWVYDIANDEWTWIAGADSAGQPGIYGTKGVSSPANTPGARQDFVTWTEGVSLWLFGGYGIDGNGVLGELNDLWEYNYVSGEWTWMSGDNLVDQSADYGIQGVASETNKPGGIYGAVSWLDPGGYKLWLYGGLGHSETSFGRLNDLWYYDKRVGKWTLHSGIQNTINFGVKGKPDPFNAPPDQLHGMTWVDKEGHFWIMGGYGTDVNGDQGLLSALWQLVSEPGVLEFSDQDTKAFIKSKNEYNSLTIEMWFKTEDTDSRGTGNERITLIQSDNTFFTDVGIDVDTSVPEKTLTFTHFGLTNLTTTFDWIDLEAAQWYHIAATYNGDSTKIYIDGIKAVSAANNGTITSSGDYTIGGNDLNPGWYLEGSLSKIRIWNKALSLEEINLYRSTDVSGNEIGLEGAWLSLDGRVHSVIDKSEKHKNLINLGGTYTKDYPPLKISIGGNEGWRFLGAPGGISTYGDLLDEVWTQGFTGSDGGTGSESNVYFYNESIRSWVTPLNATNRIGLVSNSGNATGKGILTYIYADDDNDGIDEPFPKELNLNTYEQSLQNLISLSFTESGFLPSDGWNLVSNPYPVAIYWGDVVKNGNNQDMLDYAYIWDHSMNNGAGGYQVHYGEPVPPSFPGANSTFDGRIPAFQSFWVKAEQEGASLKLQRSDFTLNRNIYKHAPNSSVSHIKLTLEGQGFTDELSVVIPAYEEQLRDDVPKLHSLSGRYAEIYLPGEQGSRWMTHHLYPIEEDIPVSIPVAFESSVSGEFTLSWDIGSVPEGWEARLVDKLQNRSYDLAKESEICIKSESSTAQKTNKWVLPVAPGSQVHNKSTTPRFELVLRTSVSTGVESVGNIPENFSLAQNYPNPFNPTTQINYAVPQAADILLVVYDMLGRKVTTLVDRHQNPGLYSASFNASELASGIYIYRLEAGSTVLTRKMTLIK